MGKTNLLWDSILTIDEIEKLFYSQETWKSIPGFEGLYEISDLGRVRSLSREIKNGVHSTVKSKERILLRSSDGKYKSVSMFKDGTFKTRLIHRLVAQAFIPNPENKPEVNHKYGIKSDNRASELEWVNYRENKSSRVYKKKKTSQYIGVSKQKNRWIVFINLGGGKPTYLGCFKDELTAANKYQEALKFNNLENKYACI